MQVPKQHHIVDKAYRKSFKDGVCESCEAQDGTVVGAHVRAGEHAGVGRKPSDDLIVGLCFRCHADQEANPGAEWWLQNVFKKWVRAKYESWKAE